MRKTKRLFTVTRLAHQDKNICLSLVRWLPPEAGKPQYSKGDFGLVGIIITQTGKNSKKKAKKGREGGCGKSNKPPIAVTGVTKDWHTKKKRAA